MEYKVLYAKEIEDLIKIVNEHIQEGWRPQGGVATDLLLQSNVNFIRMCYQAMVRGQ